MTQRTPLFEEHLAAHAKMVDFAGWDMPLHYGSQLNEHTQVRSAAGVFDVSHMTIVDLEGDGARAYLRRLLANDVDRLKTVGKALYSCMLQEDAGVLDDLIVYRTGEGRYRVVFNAATRDKDLAWAERHASDFNVKLHERPELAMIAIQGPQARAAVHSVLSPGQRRIAEELTPFMGQESEGWFIARTGYTGEDGYEVMLPGTQAPIFWRALRAAGVKPVGLGARDTLRLEAGMNLYGTDMDETTSPLESGLGWTVAWDPADRDFIGRAALEEQRKRSDLRKFVGLVLMEKGVLRNHQAVFTEGRPAGEITSGSFSPTLGRAIALARVAPNVGNRCQVDIRGRMVPAKVVKPPFARLGKICSGMLEDR